MDPCPRTRRRRRSQALPRRKTVRWSTEEVDGLLDGVREHGVGKWATILRSSQAFNEVRTSVDLKDKWRNLASAVRAAALDQHETPKRRRSAAESQSSADHRSASTSIRSTSSQTPGNRNHQRHHQQIARHTLSPQFGSPSSSRQPYSQSKYEQLFSSVDSQSPPNLAAVYSVSAVSSSLIDPALASGNLQDQTPVDVRELPANGGPDLDYFGNDFAIKAHAHDREIDDSSPVRTDSDPMRLMHDAVGHSDLNFDDPSLAAQLAVHHESFAVAELE